MFPRMFQNTQSLPHLLPPSAYSCPEQYGREFAGLFGPAWHLIATTAELARDGDFVTAEILGRPVIVRNFAGELRAFLNVCTHRHAQLTHCRHGNSAKLKCQYHGWEYKADGSTGYIPDAQSFRPLPGGPELLKPFRVATRGPLVLVCLDDGAPDLPECLGTAATAVCDRFPAERWRHYASWSYDFAVNWKVVVENTIESYHVPIVHPHTLVRYGEPEQITHEIYPRSTVMHAPIVVPGIYRRLFNLLMPRLEPDRNPDRYRLDHVFPNLFLIPIDAMMQVMDVMPTGPESCRLTVRLFILRAARETFLTRRITAFWGWLKKLVIRQVLREDAKIYPALHRGLKASPFQGTISIREELIFAFQEYVRREAGAKGEGEEAI